MDGYRRYGRLIRQGLASRQAAADNEIWRVRMKALKNHVKIERPERERISRAEALKRVKAFAKRKEKLIAALRKDSR